MYTKVAIAIVFIIVALLISYYYFIFLPQNRAQQNKVSYYKCLVEADKTFQDKWSSMCKDDYAIYEKCANSIIGKISDCANGDGMLYLMAQNNPNDCRLPNSQLDDLNSSYKDTQNQCNTIYPQSNPRSIKYNNQERNKNDKWIKALIQKI